MAYPPDTELTQLERAWCVFEIPRPEYDIPPHWIYWPGARRAITKLARVLAIHHPTYIALPLPPDYKPKKATGAHIGIEWGLGLADLHPHRIARAVTILTRLMRICYGLELSLKLDYAATGEGTFQDVADFMRDVRNKQPEHAQLYYRFANLCGLGNIEKEIASCRN